MKTLVVVHPGSLFGSAEFNVGKLRANEHRLRIRSEILNHQGNFVVIDGFLSDEIHDDFNDAINAGMSNSEAGAIKSGQLASLSALRVWGCDAGESPFREWGSFGGSTQQLIFGGQEEAAESISENLNTDEVVVTGAWATHHGRWGCVNSVADVFRSKLPSALVRISDSALFEVGKAI